MSARTVPAAQHGDARGGRGGHGRRGGRGGHGGRRGGRVLPVLGAVRLLLVRGVRREVPLLASWCVVVMAAVLVAVGSPRFAAGVLDDAALDIARDAGPRADVVVRLGDHRFGTVAPYAERALDEVDLPTLRSVLERSVLTLAGAARPVQTLNGVELDTTGDDLLVAPALLADPATVRVVAGELPAPTAMAPVPDTGTAAEDAEDGAADRDGDETDDDAPAEGRPPLPVAVTQTHAQAAGLEVGDVIGIPRENSLVMGVRPRPVLLEVVGVVAPVDPGDVVWTDATGLWDVRRDGAVALLMPPESADTLDRILGGLGGMVVRLVVDPERFTAETVRELGPEVDQLAVGLDPLLPSNIALRRPTVTTGLGDLVAAYTPTARAATAQLSVPTAGAVGAVAVVLVLLARLVVDRRRAVIELERARGTSVGAVALRLGVESLLVTAVATALGLRLLAWWLPGATAVAALAVVVAAAVLATPAWGALVARRAWSGVREPANRRDRARLARRRAVARVVGEVAVVALAFGAAVALRGRGLLQTTTESVDPFLAAAPVLIAVAATLVVLRLYPWPVRAAAALARRTPGALGIVGATRARRALAPLPLLALTLAASVGISGLVLVGTVRDGQVVASWQLIPADVTVSGPGVAEVAERLADAPGVTRVTTADISPEAHADLGNRNAEVSVLAIDDAWADAMADVPGTRDLGDIPLLTGATMTDGKLPVVVDTRLARRIGDRPLSIAVDGTWYDAEVIGTTTHRPVGLARGPFVYAPIGAVVDDDGERLEPTVAWAYGPGAADAAHEIVADVAAAEAAEQASSSRSRRAAAEEVTTAQGRLEWLDARRSSSLVDGVERALVLGAGVAALVAAVGMTATALAGSRERGRTLALLRTLGMRARLGWWLALAELAPVVLAAVGAGAVAGATVVGVLGEALGLDVLVGGPTMPAVSVDPTALAWVGAAAVALLLVAVAVDVVAHRRDRLSEVLRVGETPGG